MTSVTLIKKIGEGAFGKVYLGDRRGNKCAVKVVNLSGASQKIVDDTIKEGKLLETLNHPNIVRCEGCYGAGNNKMTEIHIIMEYCGGGDLYGNIKQRRASGHYFTESQVTGWFLDVIKAVEYLHSKGVIHRDIKPLNILKHENGTIKLGDFGLAKILRSKKDIQASVMGTIIYASPELHLKSVCDSKGDMWSLGCTLYELSKLEPAFRNAGEMIKFVQKRGSLRPIPRSYSSKVNELINSLLHVFPNDRPSATRVREILEEKPKLDANQKRVGAAPAKREVLGSPSRKRCLEAQPRKRSPGQIFVPQERGNQLMVQEFNLIQPQIMLARHLILPGHNANINLQW